MLGEDYSSGESASNDFLLNILEGCQRRTVLKDLEDVNVCGSSGGMAQTSGMAILDKRCSRHNVSQAVNIAGNSLRSCPSRGSSQTASSISLVPSLETELISASDVEFITLQLAWRATDCRSFCYPRTVPCISISRCQPCWTLHRS